MNITTQTTADGLSITISGTYDYVPGPFTIVQAPLPCTMASDIRLKRGIIKLDTIAGINLYSFTYALYPDARHVGVLAQELLDTEYKDCVLTRPDGYYVVEYHKLPEQIRRHCTV